MLQHHARPLATIGLEFSSWCECQVLLGALAMQQWGIRPIPDEERLDMSHYTREFLKF